MDELVGRAIGLAEQKAKKASDVPWRANEPWKQPWHVYSIHEQRWQPASSEQAEHSLAPVTNIALYSWNIDFMLPYPDSRMRAGLRHLQRLIREDQTEEETHAASVIFLQECVASDLWQLKNDGWVQENFRLTDTDTENWQSGHYGTTTLVDRRLHIKDVFRVHYEKTRMQRDGLFIDIQLSTGEADDKVIRLCNTHLESLALEPPLRPAQVQLCAQYLQSSDVAFGAMAGDFNAIQPFDRTLHAEHKLVDAFLERGGSEDDAEGGHTWGQQAATTQRERFGTSRMDKVFFCGPAMRCVHFERFGAGVEVENKEEGKGLVALGFDKPWITDHLGVTAVFVVGDGDRLS